MFSFLINIDNISITRALPHYRRHSNHSMSKRKFLQTIQFSCLLGLFLATVSCEKFEGNQTIPAYLKIDSIFLQTDYSTEGTAFQSFTDAWVYIDDALIGAFQLPAEFPVLAKGTHKLTIMPGIKKNGIAATRTNYPFCESIITNINLYEDSTVSLGGQKTVYQSTTEFFMIENFDGVVLSLDTTKRSVAGIQQTPSGWPGTFEGSHSGLIRMDSVGSMFECTNKTDFIIPAAPVYMELNFNTNISVAVGVFLYGYSSIVQAPVVYLSPTEGKWKKIYIDLTNALNSQTGMVNFRIFFNAIQPAGVINAEIRLDNIKVLTRDLSKK